jgi:hypothetical protein
LFLKPQKKKKSLFYCFLQKGTERYRGTEGQRDRGTDRGTEGQRDRGTEGQRDRGTEGQRDRGWRDERWKDGGPNGHRIVSERETWRTDQYQASVKLTG